MPHQSLERTPSVANFEMLLAAHEEISSCEQTQMNILTKISKCFRISLIIVAFSGCHHVQDLTGNYDTAMVEERVTLTKNAPVDSQSGLRLISVEPDGTAHMDMPKYGDKIRLNPNNTNNMFWGWYLESTDPKKQTASLYSVVCRPFYH